MKYLILFVALILTVQTFAQNTRPPRSPLDPTNWGVVYDVPETKGVTVKNGVTYFKDASSDLQIDIYSPPKSKTSDKLPAVIFLNAIGDQPDNKVKSWGIYSSWPRLVAAHGMVGISMDADNTRIQDSLKALFSFLERDGAKYGIDPTRLGVYAASANVTQSTIYLMSEGAAKGIQAAALYYGSSPSAETRIRKDLPVLFILAEGDMGGFGQQSVTLWQRVTEARAPWTLLFASNMIHAFDAFQDDDDSRRIVMQTLAFWKTHLEPVRQPSWERSPAREIVAATYGNDSQKTADLLTAYIAKNPNDAQAHVSLARALSNLGKVDEAAVSFERALQIAPTDLAAMSGLGQTRFRQRRYADAETLLKKAIEGGFVNSLIYGQLAFSQLSSNKNEEAIRSYESAFRVGIPPGANTRGVAYYNMACAYVRLKNYDKAFEMLGKAIDEGYTARASFETDTDLSAIRSDARFATLLERLPKTQN